ncbi:MAG TPA: glycoside hydrolase family 38 C-terminal domain-containing protein [Oscillospiraceae bacterium]|nr:glycoside hydrolase family 38 C-terminal domain-containing protein [Oscillospiraceae bacterium]HPK36612.1 glycoside hydrolase family 38 C-terminal domain-containing protein [Oscillospiraceae bacterium]HPR76882.1 glycoside hydrolase family 38 C-terminal domain-containing protein [Oscillospiraceae bacterium]
MEKRRMHLICNAHIDPVWLWNREEGIGAAISTFRTAVRICKEYNHFIFNHNEAVLYKYIEEYDPQLFGEIQTLVKEGKWNLMGGWYLQPDCTMPSGEAFVRQIEMGQNYFREKFGVDRFDTAINFDPFGHTVGLVQIMAKAGYSNYIVTRPERPDGGTESFHNKTFVWNGFCGSKIFVFKSRRYNSPLGNVMRNIDDFYETQKDKAVVGALWGVGDHGGGPSEIDMKDLEKYIAESDMEVIHSTPDKFFEDYKKNCKPDFTVDGSFTSWAIGCYTSMTRVKQTNRKLENQLLIAEKLNSAMVANGLLAEYPGEKLYSAWEDLMFWQFHDSLPGSSIQQVENDVLQGMGHGLEITSKANMKAFFAGCGGQTPPKAGEMPVLVCNSLPYTITREIECEYMIEDSKKDGGYTTGIVHDESGKILPCQNEKESSNLPLDWAKKVTFIATLPPMSISRFNITNKVVYDGFRLPFKAENGYYTFDNGELSVKINAETGLMDSYCVNGKEFLKPGSAKLLVMADTVDPWGMKQTEIRDVIGEFKPASKKRTAEICGVTPKAIPNVRVIENGEVRTVIEAVFTYKNSALCMRYYLPKKGKNVRINLRVFSMDRSVMFKFALPTTIENGAYTGETAYGRDTLLTDGSERVAHGWVMLSDGKNALGVLNTGTYGSDCKDGEIRMSVLRTPAYSGHPVDDREVLPTDRLTPRIDMGERLFDYYLFGGNADEISDEIDFECAQIHQPPVPLCYMPPETGKRPKALCEIENHALELVTIRVEKDGHYRIRLFNSSPRQLKATIKFPVWCTEYAVDAQPFEIITLKADKKGKISTAKMIG